MDWVSSVYKDRSYNSLIFNFLPKKGRKRVYTIKIQTSQYRIITYKHAFYSNSFLSVTQIITSNVALHKLYHWLLLWFMATLKVGTCQWRLYQIEKTRRILHSKETFLFKRPITLPKKITFKLPHYPFYLNFTSHSFLILQPCHLHDKIITWYKTPKCTFFNRAYLNVIFT